MPLLSHLPFPLVSPGGVGAFVSSKKEEKKRAAGGNKRGRGY